MGEDLAPTVKPEQLKRELFAFEAPYVEEKLLRDGVFHSRQEYHKAFTELMKFFWLSTVAGRKLPMPSLAVDDVWHQFILFTREYHAFCDRFFGGYFHHSPNTAEAPDPETSARVMEFFRLYQKHFGRLPRIWIDCLTRENTTALLADTLARESMTPAEL